ncbi:hypothetical protein H696_03610 [Fonticula alba]|uniref:ELMO domain-containing protein n=1 Tax=Fonticula alba TaxID=691883 RepID=A0A058Z7R1_FONAL|nr:hypothetical protein H696_03610 [Fonticula alba]KCV70151.1 hypothetical protein H696_03610 [Fonticula alba]|eukprot:XP_009495757.1 hypothetical protein H696_03610 [Fonticula alba]
MLINVRSGDERIQYSLDQNMMELGWIIDNLQPKFQQLDPKYKASDYVLAVQQAVTPASMDPSDTPAPSSTARRVPVEYLTNQNLQMHLREGVELLLLVSPTVQAIEAIAGLSDSDSKRIVFGLRQKFEDPLFTQGFVANDGVPVLLNIIRESVRNSLAYALESFLALIRNTDQGWDAIPYEIILNVLVPAVAATQVNICRPALAIAIKMVQSPHYGFQLFHKALKDSPQKAYQALVDRISERTETDSETRRNALILMNELHSAADGDELSEFGEVLQEHDFSKIILAIFEQSQSEYLTSELLRYQSNIYRDIVRRRNTQINKNNPQHSNILSNLLMGADIHYNQVQQLGFATDDLPSELQPVGLLGLQCMVHFSRTHKEYLTKFISEQAARTDGRRCGFGPASVEVVKALVENFQSAAEPNASKEPALLVFEDVYIWAMQLFLNLWGYMQANEADIPKVVQLVQTQLEYMRTVAWSTVDHYRFQLVNASFKEVQQRQLQNMEAGRDLLLKPTCRSLRDKIHKEVGDFVRNQRLQCMMNGSWFPVFAPRGGRQRNAFRFFRLSPNRRFLHYEDFSEILDSPPELPNLPKRVDLSDATDLALYSASPLFARNRGRVDDEPVDWMKWTFSVMGQEEGVSLVDFVAESQSQFSEWTDGFRILLGRTISSASGQIKETDDFINTLLDYELQLRLLEIRLGQVNIPNEAPLRPPPPPSLAFLPSPHDNAWAL